MYFETSFRGRPKSRKGPGYRAAFCLLALLLVAGCSSPHADDPAHQRPFAFQQDTFSYANELVWRYDFDPVTGKTTHAREIPKPDYTHHCFVVALAARQFFDQARFDPALPAADTNTYRKLIHNVIKSNPRRLPDEPIIIPGYSNLFDFSRAHEQLLKDECGGAWESYFQRGHWRMIFPLSSDHQRQMAAQLAARVKNNEAPVVHVVRFPQLSINHAMVLFDCKEIDGGLEFSAYDPNDPKRPVPVTFRHSEGRFSIPRNRYFAGGRVDIYEIFHAWNY